LIQPQRMALARVDLTREVEESMRDGIDHQSVLEDHACFRQVEEAEGRQHVEEEQHAEPRAKAHRLSLKAVPKDTSMQARYEQGGSISASANIQLRCVRVSC